MRFKALLFLFSMVSYSFSSVTGGFYANVTEEVLTTTVSAAMAGSDLAVSSGASAESSPGNLPFDSLNRLSLAYAQFFHNSFSTSVLTWNGQPRKNLGVSLLAGYVYIPDILDTRESISNSNGELVEAKISTYSASKMLFRAGIGRRIDPTPAISIGGGLAVNAKRFKLPDIGYGIGLDAGLKALFAKPGISLALQLENMTSSYIYWNKSFQQRSYPHLRAGIAWERSFPYIYGSVRICYATPDLLANEGINSVTYELTENDNIIENIDQQEVYKKPFLLLSQGKFGVEFPFFRIIAIRMGFTNGKFSFGGGSRFWFLPKNIQSGLDMAYITHFTSLAGTYQLSYYFNW